MGSAAEVALHVNYSEDGIVSTAFERIFFLPSLVEMNKIIIMVSHDD